MPANDRIKRLVLFSKLYGNFGRLFVASDDDHGDDSVLPRFVKRGIQVRKRFAEVEVTVSIDQHEVVFEQCPPPAI